MSFYDDWYGILTNVGEYDGDDEEEVNWDTFEPVCDCCPNSPEFPCNCTDCDGTDSCDCDYCHEQ